MGRRPIWLIEDNENVSARKHQHGVSRGSDSITLSVHSIKDREIKRIAQLAYKAGSLNGTGRLPTSLKLLKRAGVRNGIVVAGSNFSSVANFLEPLSLRKLDFVCEIKRSTDLVSEPWPGKKKDGLSLRRAQDWLSLANWKPVKFEPPLGLEVCNYAATDLGPVSIGDLHSLRLFALAPGGVVNASRDVEIAITNVRKYSLKEAAYLLAWIKWVRKLDRLSNRETRAYRNGKPSSTGKKSDPSKLLVGWGAVFNESDQDSWLAQLKNARSVSRGLKNRVGRNRKWLNVVELFSGAGGLGLGFLLSRSKDTRFRMLFSGEVHPIYSETLKRNIQYLEEHSDVNRGGQHSELIEPIDLRLASSVRKVSGVARGAGGVHVLIGGPPCQGFSQANRNSNGRNNPNNELINIYLKYVKALEPLVVVLENVEGIIWSKRSSRVGKRSVLEHVVSNLNSRGYLVFAKLLDAAWYGVPQHRNRVFVVGVHKDLGYSSDDFADWGPFPGPSHGPLTRKPFTTVREAIGDLPLIDNGEQHESLPYSLNSKRSGFLGEMRRFALRNSITDHTVSRHADYVIDRYKQIPEGGNWRDIAHTMSNYAAIDRTHSNIYRRLIWDQPAITIGHYRKAMLVHPSQHRGLSLREASRLQSFPDWFRFAGSVENGKGGLMHKQQQLANAVCPLVSRAIAEFVSRL